MKKPYDITILIYLLLLLWLITSCATIKPDHSKQAVLVEFDRVAMNKAVLVLVCNQEFGRVQGSLRDTMMPQKHVIYFQKLRGAGRGRWNLGDRYTIHFRDDKVVKITLNQ